MTKASGKEVAGAQVVHESYGALVGWSHSAFKDRLNLKLQSIGSTRLASAEEVDSHSFMMTKTQAAVLANYLYQISGQTPPRRRGWLARLLGR